MITIHLINDEFYMRLALQLAESAQGQTGINPVVGCVVVKDGRIVGTGAHLRRGGPHAEVHALNMAGSDAEGATVYVTLEPCSHYGRTPPCADRIIREKAAKVVIAAKDPNPRVSGGGIAKLREQGIEVVVGVLEAESRLLNESFEKYMLTGTPFVTLKSASTLDGKIAAKTGDSKWISSDAARERVHAMRHRHEAIMVGIETVLADNPRLTARLTVPALDPIRIIVDSRLRLPETSAVFQSADRTPVYVVTTDEASEDRAKALERAGARIVRCGTGPRVDLQEAMRQLGKLEIGSVLLEGGGRLNGAMLEAGLVDKVVLFMAPIIVGGGASAPGAFEFDGFAAIRDAYRLDRLQVETIGDNVCFTGYPILHKGGGER